MRTAEIIERKASISNGYDIIMEDWHIYMKQYSFHTIFISILKSYSVHYHLYVNGRPIWYENISDPYESNIM